MDNAQAQASERDRRRRASFKALTTQGVMLHGPAIKDAAARTACIAPPDMLHFSTRLRHAAETIAAGKPLKIVAVGSSSTAGAGASSGAAAYPSRLKVELAQLLPHQEVTVINRGVNGQITADMIARFYSEVLPEKPDLVIWQLGTNSVLRDYPVEPERALVDAGVGVLRSMNTDVIFLDPQFAPKVNARPHIGEMVALLSEESKHTNVDIFRRYDLMRFWHETKGIPYSVSINGDGLHMTDWGYACLAKTMAVALADAMTRPIVSATTTRH
jgi:lysophospholipase L1-like esterase